MLDNICMVMENVSMSQFNEILKRRTGYVEVKKDEHVVKINWYNMRIVYRYKSEIIELKNSVHKLYNIVFGVGKPDNSTDFTLSQFRDVVNFIADTFDCDVGKIRLQGRLEFGINIESEKEKAYSLLERYISHQGNRINGFVTVPPRKGKAKHRSCYLTDYYIKGYYKNSISQLGVKSEKNVIRFEIVTTELRMLRKITGLEHILLSDLLRPDIWLRFAEFGIKTYDRIKKIPLERETMPLEDSVSINLYCNNLFYGDASKILNGTQLKKLRENQKEVYDKWDCSENNLHNEIRDKLLNKFYLVINN